MKVLVGSLVMVVSASVVAEPAVRERPFSTKITFSEMTLSADTCDNSVNGGPGLNFAGNVVVASDVAADIVLKQNVSGQKIPQTVGTARFVISTTPPPQGFSKNPTLGGAGGNPHISYKWQDETQFSYIGRCVQGGSYSLNDKELDAPGRARGRVQARSCGRDITSFNFNASVDLPSASGTVQLSNNEKLTHKKEADATFGVNLQMNNPVTIEKNFARDFGVGGNPMVFLKFSGDQEIYLGRCKELF